MKRFQFFAVLVAPLFVSVAHAQESTWDVISHQIFGENCASCHQAGNGFAIQSDLVLTSDVAYDQLINRAPYNETALDDGLLRVSNAGGQPGLGRSFLWEKINAPNQDHFYDDHPDYGALMPLGDLPLTNGELDFIRTWLLKGAPETGVVASVDLLNDTSRYEEEFFQPLDLPEEGIQLHLGPYEVWYEELHDREFYYFQPHVTEEDTFIRGYDVTYRQGSHHFILYHYEAGEETPEANVYRDIRTPDGQGTRNVFDGLHASWLVASQAPTLTSSFPEKVALRLPPGSGFDFNVHSVNRTGSSRDGEVYVNLHTVDRENVLHVANENFMGKFDIFLPPGKVTTLEETFTFGETHNVVQLWTHAHEKMVEFRVEYASGDRDGELLYWTNDWEHPRMLSFDEPLVFREGDRVKLIATYNNNTDKPVTYGPLSTDEMMFMFFISYPDTEDVNRDGRIDVADIDQISSAARRGLYVEDFDITFDGVVDQDDRERWVKDHLKTAFGDSNLNGQFDSSDLVQVFIAGEYEDDIDKNSGWAEGDWDGDGDFTTSDLVFVFEEGGYEAASKPDTPTVPEPTSGLLGLVGVGLTWLALRRRT